MNFFFSQQNIIKIFYKTISFVFCKLSLERGGPVARYRPGPPDRLSAEMTVIIIYECLPEFGPGRGSQKKSMVRPGPISRIRSGPPPSPGPYLWSRPARKSMGASAATCPRLRTTHTGESMYKTDGSERIQVRPCVNNNTGEHSYR